MPVPGRKKSLRIVTPSDRSARPSSFVSAASRHVGSAPPRKRYMKIRMASEMSTRPSEFESPRRKVAAASTKVTVAPLLSSQKDLVAPLTVTEGGQGCPHLCPQMPQQSSSQLTLPEMGSEPKGTEASTSNFRTVAVPIG